MDKKEIWHDIAYTWRKGDTENRHEVSNRGRVRHKRSGNILKSSIRVNADGSRCVTVTLERKGKISSLSVSQLVGKYFHGNKGKGLISFFLDGDPTNVDIDNITMVTRSQFRFLSKMQKKMLKHMNSKKKGENCS